MAAARHEPLWMARSKGQLVAAIIILTAGQYAKDWRGVLLKELGAPVAATELLHRLAIEVACRDGYRFYDMDGASPGSPIAAYKVKLGATLQFHPRTACGEFPVARHK